MATATCFVTNKKGHLVPLDGDRAPSILDALLKRAEEQEELPWHHGNIPPYTLKHMGAMAAADIPAHHPLPDTSQQCTDKSCPYRLYRRGKDGKQLITGPVAFCTGCD